MVVELVLYLGYSGSVIGGQLDGGDVHLEPGGFLPMQAGAALHALALLSHAHYRPLRLPAAQNNTGTKQRSHPMTY